MIFRKTVETKKKGLGESVVKCICIYYNEIYKKIVQK